MFSKIKQILFPSAKEQEQVAVQPIEKINTADESATNGMWEFDHRNVLQVVHKFGNDFALVESYYDLTSENEAIKYYFINVRIPGVNDGRYFTVRMFFNDDNDYAKNYAEEIFGYFTMDI